MRRRNLILITILAMTMALVLSLTGCGQDDAIDLTSEETKVAVEPTTPQERAIDKFYPDVTKVYVDSAMAGMMSVKTGKVDAFMGEDLVVNFTISNGFDGVRTYGDPVGDSTGVSVAIAKKTKIDGVEEQLNEFIAEIKSNGVYDDMYNRWLVDKNYEMPEIDVPTDADTTIKVATSSLIEPYTFMRDNEPSGFDVELAKRFAAYAGYNLDLTVYDWAGLYTAIGTSRVDMAFSHIYTSQTAGNNIIFSDPYMECTPVLVVDSDGQGAGFLDNIRENLVNDFAKGGGWQLIGRGLLATIEITLLSLIFGTICGYLLCLLKRSRYKALSKTTTVVTRIIQGIPLLVLLLLVYYVFFTSSSPMVAAVIAFTINFGAYSSEAMKSSINAVSMGQWEAAYALGFSKAGAFRRVVLPQTIRNLMPGYKSSTISLVLLTSVVGYVSAMDLTYATQMIRQRTYDAVLPLMVVAIIYILLTLIISVTIEKSVNHALGKHSLLDGVDRTKPVPLAMDAMMSATASAGSETDKDQVLIDVKGLTMAFPQATPLKDLDCQVRKGEVISIIGPSGTGKSTLIRCINRLQTPTKGSITVFGDEIATVPEKELPPLRRRMGMVFQHFNLFEHMTNIENIMLAQVYVQGKSKQEAYDYGMYLLKAVGLADKADDYPDTLSGGQKQRVAIVRTLATQPDIILIDEPTSALDPKMVDEILILIGKLRDMGMTMMIVTHEMRFARTIASRVFYMDQGIVYEDGAPEQIFDAPKTDRCRVFVNNYKTFKFKVENQNFDFLGATAEATEFAQKYYLSKMQTTKLYQILEELCYLHIYPRLAEGETLEFEAEYHEKSKHCYVNARWTGEEYHVLEDGDEVSLAIINAHLEESNYEYEDGVNKISLRF